METKIINVFGKGKEEKTQKAISKKYENGCI
jgi:hypothetical protein